MHEYMYDYKVENALRDSYSKSFLHLILKADKLWLSQASSILLFRMDRRLLKMLLARHSITSISVLNVHLKEVGPLGRIRKAES